MIIYDNKTIMMVVAEVEVAFHIQLKRMGMMVLEIMDSLIDFE